MTPDGIAEPTDKNLQNGTTFEITLIVFTNSHSPPLGRQRSLGVKVHSKVHSSITRRALEEDPLKPSHSPSEILTI
jgi:hypothetical protein